MRVQLIDPTAASALAQILPVLLLALLVEMRRTQIHRRGRSLKRSRAIVGSSFALFALVETVLVMSTDGAFIPFKWGDLASAVIIFTLLWLIFIISLTPSTDEPSPPKREMVTASTVPESSQHAPDDSVIRSDQRTH